MSCESTLRVRKNTNRNPEGEWQDEADGERDRHHMVDALGAEHLRAEGTPGDRVRCWRVETRGRIGKTDLRTVVTLSVLSRPQTSSRNRQKCVTIVVDN